MTAAIPHETVISASTYLYDFKTSYLCCMMKWSTAVDIFLGIDICALIQQVLRVTLLDKEIRAE